MRQAAAARAQTEQADAALRAQRTAARQAREHMEAHPQEGAAMGARRRAELDSVLTTMVPPSHALYSVVFPDRLICADFEQRLHATATRTPHWMLATTS